MTFVWPHVLWALALPLAWALRRRRRPVAATAAPGAHPHIATAEAAAGAVRPASRAAERQPGAWLAWAFAFAVLALARPQWGRAEAPATQSAREILLALDLSRSMLTPDVPPSRLERSKLLAQSLLDELRDERVGLMVFAGSPFLQAPLSSDYEILREFLPQLRPGYLPDGGTNYGPLLAAAANAFTADSGADRFLVLLSDGGANDEGWTDQIGALRRQGIRVIALGVGTAAGGFIPDGRGGFVKDERGAVVLSKLDSASLRRLAQETGGVYRDAGSWVDVAGLVRSTIEAGKAGRFADRRLGRPIERYQWALGAALLCLLCSLYREFPVRPRPRTVRWAGASAALVLLALRGSGAGGAAAAAPALPPQELLGHIVDRLATSASPPSALDWAELAHQTLTWGQAFADSGQPAPAGPVDDALAGVTLGGKADPKAADWPSLEKALTGLLHVPPPPKPPPPSPSPNQTQPPPPPPAPPPPSPEAAQDPSLAAPLQQLDRVRNADSPAELFQMLDRQNRRPPPPATPNAKDW